MRLCVIVCYLEVFDGIKRETDFKIQLLHKCKGLPRLVSKNEISQKKLQVSLSSGTKIFNGRNRISWSSSWKQSKNHQRVITRNQHLIRLFFILHWFWLSINSREQKIFGCTYAMATFEQFVGALIVVGRCGNGIFSFYRNIIFCGFMLT